MKFAKKIQEFTPSILPVIRMTDPQIEYLSTTSIQMQSISQKNKVLIECLKMTAAEEGVISLNAKQVGIPQAFCVILKQFKRNQWFYNNLKPTDYNVYINLKIIKYYDQQEVEWEQCASYPYLMGKKIRPYKIDYSYRNESFNYFHHQADDFLARVLQHELDHFKGKLMDEDLTNLQETHRQGKHLAYDLDLMSYQRKCKNLGILTQQLRNQNQNQ